jgi:hypothetical protein
MLKAKKGHQFVSCFNYHFHIQNSRGGFKNAHFLFYSENYYIFMILI